jgi:hypothetical protein
MRRLLPIVLLALAIIPSACSLADREGIRDPSRQIAFLWGDSRQYGPAFYGAQVYYQPQNGGVAVKARVWIGRGNDYFQDLGVIGRASSPEDAVGKFGTVVFRDDGLHIGSPGHDAVFVPRNELEAHR